jgi:hypothetical protein
MARRLLALYAIGAVAVATPLALALGYGGDLADTTSGKVLAAALLAMGYGAFRASRDPWRHRLTVQMLIMFTSLAALSIVYRLAQGRHENDLAWFVLPFAVVAPILLTVFYPRGPKD